jgi:hypothetical protein
MNMENKSTEIEIDQNIIVYAASCVRRAHELISDGWVKGRMQAWSGGVPTEFCIHGALELALKETFGERRTPIVDCVEQVASAYITNECFGKIGSWAAGYNDARERTHDEVLGVLDRASNRLWSVSFDDVDVKQTMGWAESSDQEAQKQFLYASWN